MSIANVLFDLDGTLTDSKIGIFRSIRFALKEQGFDAPNERELTWCIGPPIQDSFRRLLPSLEASVIDETIRIYRQRYSEIGIYENTLYPGIPLALSEIKEAGFKLFLATSKLKDFATRILDHFSLSVYFDAIYGSELDGTRSDKTELIRYILETESLHPQETLIIGDRKHDILGGKANGIFTGAVTYGYGSNDELENAKPNFTFATPSAFADYFQKIQLVKSAKGMWADCKDKIVLRQNDERLQ